MDSLVIKNLEQGTIRTIDQVLDNKKPSLAAYAQILHGSFPAGKMKIATNIQRWIFQINVKMGLKKPMTAESIRFASQVILEDYSYLTPDDIVLWLTNVAKGNYTDIYGSALDGPTLLKTLKKYVNNRIDTAAARSLRRHDNIQHQEKDVERVSNKR